MRMIDADKLRKDVLELPNCYNGYSDTYDKAMILDLVDEQPTVDAVPVVRCKDCIYYYPFTKIKGKGECRIVEDAECITWYEDCDYCSYGERREDATD